MSRALLSVLAVLSMAGCMARTGVDQSERHGWFKLHTLKQGQSYNDHFQRLGTFLEQVPCTEVAPEFDDSQKPIFVVVHGVGGEGPEMKSAVPELVESRPTAAYALRWNPWDQREPLVNQLATGLSRIAECSAHTGRPIIVLAHSAGGVLASLAASRVVAPADAPQGWLTVVTIAAPLAGAIYGDDCGPEVAFMIDLANTPAYREPARGVRVMHLRTTLKGDLQMAPIAGRAPNDPRIGVPGAPQYDLPSKLTHAGALIYVTRLYTSDGFDRWLASQDPVQASTGAPATASKKAPVSSGTSISTASNGGRGPPIFRQRTELYQW